MKTKAFRAKNWESHIDRVSLEPCPVHEDPMGYRAVFMPSEDEICMPHKGGFSIGASHLAKRAENLHNAGYHAPMTEKALAMIQSLGGNAVNEQVITC